MTPAKAANPNKLLTARLGSWLMLIVSAVAALGQAVPASAAAATPGFRAVTSIKLGFPAGEVAVNPATNKVYVAAFANGLVVVNGRTDTVVTTIHAGTDLTETAITDDTDLHPLARSARLGHRVVGGHAGVGGQRGE